MCLNDMSAIEEVIDNFKNLNDDDNTNVNDNI